MADIKIYKELSGLPEELEKWGKKALSQIESPEKAHEAAKVLREKMDQLWEDCPARDEEDKVIYVLKKLGKPEAVAEELKENYKIKNNLKTDRIAGVVCLGLSLFCAVYPIMVFLAAPNLSVDTGTIYRDYRTGVGAGSGAVCAIAFLILGMWLLLHNRKREE